jgi:hypothetical protein
VERGYDADAGGAPRALGKLIGILELRLPDGPRRRYRLLDRILRDARPVVFVGPYEHHPNELSWRETIADVVIGADADGHIDLADLAGQLDRYADRPLRIGSFSPRPTSPGSCPTQTRSRRCCTRVSLLREPSVP